MDVGARCSPTVSASTDTLTSMGIFSVLKRLHIVLRSVRRNVTHVISLADGYVNGQQALERPQSVCLLTDGISYHLRWPHTGRQLFVDSL